MTFIASVVAKDGVAIIADSLVTSSRRVIEIEQFFDFLKKKGREKQQKDKGNKSDQIVLDPMEIISLFELKRSHTRDFEDKLYQYDEYTAITTTGVAEINGKRIKRVVKDIYEEFTSTSQKRGAFKRQKINTKVKNFCGKLEEGVRKEFNENGFTRGAKLYFTHFDKNTFKTIIYEVTVYELRKEKIDIQNPDLVKYKLMPDYIRVVCDGMNRISERILFGDIYSISEWIPNLLKKFREDFNISDDKVPDKYLSNLLDNAELRNQWLKDAYILKLNQLSLQQAVNLANLLMRVEIDFQKYTENIPTVGGVIKLAVIDEYGFRYVKGHKIIKPN